MYTYYLLPSDNATFIAPFLKKIGLKGLCPLKEVKTVYRDLTKDADLAQCLHGITQNANESLNAMFWERAPKSNYCGIDKLQLSVYDSVDVFN